jgi:hypothetical protein
MEAITNLQPTEISNVFDEQLKELLIEEIIVFKSTRGRFLCNNQRKYQNNHLVA